MINYCAIFVSSVISCSYIILLWSSTILPSVFFIASRFFMEGSLIGNVILVSRNVWAHALHVICLQGYLDVYFPNRHLLCFIPKTWFPISITEVHMHQYIYTCKLYESYFPQQKGQLDPARSVQATHYYSFVMKYIFVTHTN